MSRFPHPTELREYLLDYLQGNFPQLRVLLRSETGPHPQLLPGLERSRTEFRIGQRGYRIIMVSWEIPAPRPNIPWEERCPLCEGSGLILLATCYGECDVCEGTGRRPPTPHPPSGHQPDGPEGHL